MALNPTPLDERVNKLRQDIDLFIDARVREEKKLAPGIPEGVLRNILTARSGGCHCEALLAIKLTDDKA